MQFDAYFTVLQNAAQQINHGNQVNKHPVKRVINYLDLTLDEFKEFSPSPSVPELSISKAWAKSTFKPHEDVQDPNTLHVLYELFIKLPPWVKLLIHKVQKAGSGNQLHKANVHEVYESCQLILLLIANGAERL